MKAPTSNLEVAGISVEEVSTRLLDGMAQGLVLLRRSVSAGTGIDARKVSQTWVAVRPVLRDGVVVELVEDDETRAVNRVGRLQYGLRPANVDKRMLRAICPDVYWLGPRGAQKVVGSGRAKPVDLWSQLRPSAVNHVPAHDGIAAVTKGVGSDPVRALKHLSRGDAQAIAALLEGLHIVDMADMVESSGGHAERRTWRPMRPVLDEVGVPVCYGTDERVTRHTLNAGRTGFSPATFAAISPLLVEAGYDPKDGETGHAYRLADKWIDAARNTIGWAPEIVPPQLVVSPAMPESMPTPRQAAILAMLAGLDHVAEGDSPTHHEVAEAIALHGGAPAGQIALITAALGKAAANARGGATENRATSWWRRR